MIKKLKINRNNLKDEREETLLSLKSDVRLLTVVPGKLMKISNVDHEINPLFFVSVFWFT